MHDLADVVTPIFAFFFLFGIPGVILFWFLHTRHKERTKLIDKGLTPEEVRAYYTNTEKKPKNPYSTLKWGILFTFLGLGLFISYFLSEVYDMSDSITPAFLLFFGGLGFIIYFIIVNKKLSQNSNNAGKN
jgi:hypothetical protein